MVLAYFRWKVCYWEPYEGHVKVCLSVCTNEQLSKTCSVGLVNEQTYNYSIWSKTSTKLVLYSLFVWFQTDGVQKNSAVDIRWSPLHLALSSRADSSVFWNVDERQTMTRPQYALPYVFSIRIHYGEEHRWLFRTNYIRSISSLGSELCFLFLFVPILGQTYQSTLNDWD